MSQITPRNRFVLAAAAAASALTLAAGNAHAYLGGFEAADGYQSFLNRVQDYNAGHYGANSGYGGGPVAITPNTDFWVAVSGGVGGSYATGHQWFDRDWVNNGTGSQNDLALQFTSNASGWGGPAMEYRYSVDAPDLGGVNPASTGGAVVKISFWYRAALNGADNFGGIPEGYFGNAIQVRDSANNVGLELGITQRATGDKVTYWNGSTLLESAIPASEYLYDRWDLTIDLANDTFSADYFEFLTSTTTTVVSNQPLMTPLNDLSVLDFRTGPGITNDKHFGLAVDDFTFVVPEPATAGALILVGGALLMRRPRRA